MILYELIINELVKQIQQPQYSLCNRLSSHFPKISGPLLLHLYISVDKLTILERVSMPELVLPVIVAISPSARCSLNTDFSTSRSRCHLLISTHTDVQSTLSCQFSVGSSAALTIICFLWCFRLKALCKSSMSSH